MLGGEKGRTALGVTPAEVLPALASATALAVQVLCVLWQREMVQARLWDADVSSPGMLEVLLEAFLEEKGDKPPSICVFPQVKQGSWCKKGCFSAWSMPGWPGCGKSWSPSQDIPVLQWERVMT